MQTDGPLFLRDTHELECALHLGAVGHNVDIPWTELCNVCLDVMFAVVLFRRSF